MSKRHVGKLTVYGRWLIMPLWIAIATQSLSAKNTEPVAVLQSARSSEEMPMQEAIRDALIYSYPLYALSTFRWRALNERDGRTSTTLNHFAHQRELTTPQDTWAGSPLVDGLYSTAWLDLRGGPVRLSTPASHDRYYVLTLIDFFSNTFSYIGTRTTGNQAHQYVVVGPGWHGTLPKETVVVNAPTNNVYVNLRVGVDGQADLSAATHLQDGFAFTELEKRSTSSLRSIEPKVGDAASYIDVVNEALALNPPPAEDRSLLKQYRGVGICGADCGWKTLPEKVRQTWQVMLPTLLQRLNTTFSRAPSNAPGWINFTQLGSKLGSTEERDFAVRASGIAHGLGILGLAPAEAAYSVAMFGSDGKPLTGDKRYLLHIPAGGIPSSIFWSITLYEFREGNQFLVENPLRRYHVGSRTPGYRPNPDGSIDVLIQTGTPSSDKVSNWLPGPRSGARFWLFARSYGPKEEVLTGKFKLPPVELIPDTFTVP